MNGLEFVLILLVPLAVWILSSIFKSEEDRPGARPAAGNRPPVQRRPVTDLERFLEEARRRREMAGSRQPPAPEAPPRPAPMREKRPAPIMEQRQARVPQQPRRRQVEGPPSPRRQPVLLEAVPAAPPVVALAIPEEMTRVADAGQRAAAATTVVAAEVAAPPRPGAPLAKTSPALRHFAALLRSPQSAGTAIVLREVFDQPLCRRRR
jgi:hypothetical protein